MQVFLGMQATFSAWFPQVWGYQLLRVMVDGRFCNLILRATSRCCRHKKAPLKDGLYYC